MIKKQFPEQCKLGDYELNFVWQPYVRVFQKTEKWFISKCTATKINHA
jgi:hypothetical protein